MSKSRQARTAKTRSITKVRAKAIGRKVAGRQPQRANSKQAPGATREMGPNQTAS